MSQRIATIHASAVLVGAAAVLIRGASGAGKSRLALELLQAAEGGALRFARLVGDDRIHIEAAHGRLLVRPALALAGLLEIRGWGVRRIPYEPVAVAGLVVDLGAAADRLPLAADTTVAIDGVRLARLAIPAERPAFPLVLAALSRPRTQPGPGGI